MLPALACQFNVATGGVHAREEQATTPRRTLEVEVLPRLVEVLARLTDKAKIEARKKNRNEARHGSIAQ